MGSHAGETSQLQPVVHLLLYWRMAPLISLLPSKKEAAANAEICQDLSHTNCCFTDLHLLAVRRKQKRRYSITLTFCFIDIEENLFYVPSR